MGEYIAVHHLFFIALHCYVCIYICYIFVCLIYVRPPSSYRRVHKTESLQSWENLQERPRPIWLQKWQMLC